VITDVIKNIRLEADFLRSLPRETIVQWVFLMLRAAVTCLKHEGFSEERHLHSGDGRGSHRHRAGGAVSDILLLDQNFLGAFGMGVVSGIVMPFQFGTNWSFRCSRRSRMPHGQSVG
jgi:hypothetical protein